MKQKILEIQNLTVTFDGLKVLNELNFSMEVGELRVVIGPNGAGKTTLLDVVSGKIQPSGGSVLFKGKSIKGIPEYQLALKGIGRKFQGSRVYQELTARENLELSVNQNKGVLSTLFRATSPTEKRSVMGLLETIGLSERADLISKYLSYGEKQRLEIGMLVAQSPDLLLVDELMTGLTDEETKCIGDLLLALSQSHSILVIEDDLEFVRQIAGQVSVLYQGGLLCEGTIDEVQNDPKVIEVYLGKAD